MTPQPGTTPALPLPRWGRRVCAAAVTALLLAGCTGTNEGLNPGASTSPATSSGTAGNATGAPGTGTYPDIPHIVATVQPSVVTIVTQEGLGSGVIYSADGYIVTNQHVVGSATTVQVAFADGRRESGTVTASDALSDLALVKVNRTDLPAAQFDTNLPQVGELAVVLGSPLGFEDTATAGIISGVHRDIPGSATNGQALVDLIQTDAAISPGNSGGAVVNRDAKIVGISEAYIPPQAGAVALGFAIPAATVVDVANQLRSGGTVQHSFLGLVPANITPQIASQLGLPDTRGALVLSTVPGGPADKAGIKPGDVLLALDGTQLQSPEDLIAGLRKHNPGDVVSLDVRTGNNVHTVKVTLTDRPPSG